LESRQEELVRAIDNARAKLLAKFSEVLYETDERRWIEKERNQAARTSRRPEAAVRKKGHRLRRIQRPKPTARD